MGLGLTKQRKPLSCVSLFSGCGGLDYGLKRAGFGLVLAVDTDPLCAKSHQANFRDVPYVNGSVADLTPRRLTSFGLVPGEVDLLAGGPPCPPYSKSRFYRQEKPRALKDPLGAGTIDAYLRILRTLRPKAFLLENVAGLAYKVHGEALELILKRAKSLGYECDWRVLNAADHGVPQVRERLFVVGMKDGTFKWPRLSHRDPSKPDLLRGARAPWRTAGEAMSDLDTEENADDTGHFAGGKHHDLLRQIPPGDNYLFFTAKRGHPQPLFEWRSRYWSFLLKLSPEMPSWTIQARRSNNMGPFHWRNRILRIEEIKRLQTFPDRWKLFGTVEQQWRQIGNAVPPVLAEKVGRAVARGVREAERDKHVRAS